ncbi:MAG TPA: hypothetical protein VMC43_02640 [Candidatus Paceibacterota bacterium]|nr:hypothetical protein [Candidatus Paceibacterota bacterium]
MATIRTSFKKYSGYLLLVAWFGFLASLGYAAHVASQGARTEILGQLFPGPDSQTVQIQPQPLVKTADAGLSADLKARLSDGLDTLTNILKDLQTKTASASGGNP